MRLAEASLTRLAYFVATGNAEELERYLVACLPAGSPLAPVHAALEELTPDFRALALKVAPWLERDRVDVGRTYGEALLERLGAAGVKGITLAQLRIDHPDKSAALQSLIQSGAVIRSKRETAGRPADVYYHREHARGVIPADHNDPFAMQLPPLDFED